MFACLLQEDLSPRGTGDFSTSCCSSIENSEEQDRGPPLYSHSSIRQIYKTGSSCTPLTWRPVEVCKPLSSLLSSVHSFGEDSDSDARCSLGDCSLALAGLRGNVSQGDRCYAGPFSEDMKREAIEEEEELSAYDSVCNEGIIFYNEVSSALLQLTFWLLCVWTVHHTNLFLTFPNRKLSLWTLNTGREESMSSHSSSRKAHMVKYTKRTMSTQALHLQSKRCQSLFSPLSTLKCVRLCESNNLCCIVCFLQLALKRFNSEEVGAWSALKSPRVVELFGVVREGPNVFLLMDQKSGKQSSFLPLTHRDCTHCWILTEFVLLWFHLLLF